MEELKRELMELASGIAEGLGFSVYEFSFSKQGRKRLMKVAIDKLEGYVSLNDCETFSSEFGRVLDDSDLVTFPYDLVVESPGVERALRSSQEFKRFVGEKVKVVFSEPVQGNSVLIGKIVSCQGDVITLESSDTGKLIDFSLENVKRANLKL